ncbi:hypothetical protein H2198_000492 [Neophaeococcomyces mojaviensis]|uniref:Uncharacterized protein n=1 Tax=Neophaeococcomyces mojaviensis TaxID=3383035 RepID=A0ACC3AK43_9EURO|nr:hypothetical protein H2198_000492 [Knufia sp. JES_112]
MTDTLRFYADQTPHPVESLTPQAEVMTLQMGNVLLLLAAIAIICCWTNHSEIAFWYLIVVAFADFGHIYATYRGVGWDYLRNVGGWNDMIAGNVGVSAFLNINRWLTVFGVFGKLQGEKAREKKTV